MKNSFGKQGHTKTIAIAVLLAVIAATAVIALQDIDIPAERITQQLDTTLEK